MPDRLDEKSLKQLFLDARTRNGWTSKPVSDQQIRELYDLVKMGPTSANACPARFIWVRSQEGKANLAAHALESNRAKILAAPLTVIIGQDLDFPERMPMLFPARGEILKTVFSEPQLAEVTAFRNASLQGGYFILAARALGLDCGPMSGFDNASVDTAFFANSRIKSNFICCVGYGSDTDMFPRNPRLSFEDASRFA